MTRIKIKPLKEIEDLNLQIASKKHHKIDADHMDGLMDKILEIIADNPNVIIAQGRGDKPNSISAVLKTKSGNSIAIPEPNLVLIYFRIALDYISEAKEKYSIFIQTEKNSPAKFDCLNEYLSRTIIAITFLMTSIEAFMNQLLPENVKLFVNGKNLDKSKIEWLDLDTKIKRVLPKIKKIHFHQTNQVDYSNIIELKKIRNNLVHLKTISLANMTSYQALIETLLNFDFDKHSSSVRSLLDTIDPTLVVEE